MKRLCFAVLAMTMAVGMGCGVGSPGSESEIESTSPARPDEVRSSTSAVVESEMDCYIDSPAYDQYTPDYCFRLGTTASIASFRLRPATPACGYSWYGHPECTTAVCNVPIRPGQTISLGAYYIACSTGVPTLGAGATAEYERGW